MAEGENECVQRREGCWPRAAIAAEDNFHARAAGGCDGTSRSGHACRLHRALWRRSAAAERSRPRASEVHFGTDERSTSNSPRCRDLAEIASLQGLAAERCNRGRALPRAPATGSALLHGRCSTTNAR
jgi:hypothetical protein